mmetsp:Transcript_8498/g.14423  ORF Transcript_8498/g.14423 Transcript_8498/m.14423 type:complete len:86 (+) Transcript_8498:2468-2725(+)
MRVMMRTMHGSQREPEREGNGSGTLKHAKGSTVLLQCIRLVELELGKISSLLKVKGIVGQCRQQIGIGLVRLGENVVSSYNMYAS